MPFVMTHLAVANRIISNTDIINDQKQFYLGTISPDCVHVRSNYISDMKKAAHFQVGDEVWGSENTDSAEWRRNALVQLRSFYPRKNSDFYLGYIVHILTDISDNDKVYKPFLQRYAQEGLPPANRSRALYNDKSQNDFALFNLYPWREDVWTLLADAKGVGVENTVLPEETEVYRDIVLRQYDTGKSTFSQPVKYFTLEDNLRLIESASAEILEMLDHILFSPK